MGRQKVSGGKSSESKLKKYFDPMMDGVKWTEKYAESLDAFWDKIPSVVGSTIATFAIITVGSTLRGEWVLILIHMLKQLGWDVGLNDVDANGVEIEPPKGSLQNWSTFFISAIVGSYTMYFALGGFLHWYFYVRQRDRPQDWKCQPTKWLSPELELHEIKLGCLSLFLCNIVTATLGCYIANGGPSTVYYQFDEYGWWWFFLQFIVIFIYKDYTTYCLHRLYHIPFLYKHFHKLHHTYKQPTCFSAVSIHPVEILHVQLTMCLPIFVIPVHWVAFYGVALYNFYHGMIDHSGINFKAQWWQPWQPDAIFHDNHHQYFHVNFGFNMSLWDRIHGTFRLKDRVYTEDIFYGVGKKLSEATPEEIANDMAERESENPLAYKTNTNEYKLTAKELKKSK